MLIKRFSLVNLKFHGSSFLVAPSWHTSRHARHGGRHPCKDVTRMLRGNCSRGISAWRRMRHRPTELPCVMVSGVGSCTLAPPGKYGWTIVRGGYEWMATWPVLKLLGQFVNWQSVVDCIELCNGGGSLYQCLYIGSIGQVFRSPVRPTNMWISFPGTRHTTGAIAYRCCCCCCCNCCLRLSILILAPSFRHQFTPPMAAAAGCASNRRSSSFHAARLH